MKAIRLFLIVLTVCLLAVEAAQAQSGAPLVLVMKADGAIMPPMLEYIQRGIRTAEGRGAEALIIELDTPGGSIATMKEIVAAIRASHVPVIVYVSPRGAWAGSAGAMITMSAHASAMAPETLIGAASPVGGSGEDLGETMKAKEMEALTSLVRSLTTRRGEKVVALAESMITEAKAVTSDEALEAGLIDFVADNTDDLLEALNGFTVQMPDGPHVLNTGTARAEPLEMSLIERLLLLLTDSNVVFLLLSIGVQAILAVNPQIWDPSLIYVGQIIYLPAAPVYYTVWYGDTLYSIAVGYGTTVASLQALNGLWNPNWIYAGQVLRVR
jgi:membrane-bound serine protease (ClpP class)